MLPTNFEPLLAIATSDGFEVVALADITYIESAQNYSEAHLSDGRKLLASKGISAFEKALPPDLFIRCHDRFLVGKLHVRRFLKKDGPRLVLSNGLEIPVSQRRRGGLIGQFLFA